MVTHPVTTALGKQREKDRHRSEPVVYTVSTKANLVYTVSTEASLVYTVSTGPPEIQNETMSQENKN